MNLLSEFTQELTEEIYSVNLLSELTEEIYSLCLLHPLHTVNLLSELTQPIWANLPCELTQELIDKIYSVNFTQ